MRPLWFFVIRHYFVILFLILEGVALALFINHSYYQRSAVAGAANKMAGFFYTMRSDLLQYLSLKEMNNQLIRQNTLLLEQNQMSFDIRDTGVYVADEPEYKQQYSYIPARVINNTTQKKANHLTLNKGFTDGIRKDMAVICPEGIVGMINSVSANFSSAVSLLHPKAKISAKIKKNNYVGTVAWDGKKSTFAVLKDIPLHVKIAAGDTIMTSGYSLIFPEGIMIGTIYSYSMNEVKDFYSIQIKLSTDFRYIRNVYVVKSIYKDEFDQLEQEAQAE
jgi:rod shape-determining protein MreC